jgi:TRAP-type C4-dicarboxylate transport system permease small subunit
MNKLINGYCKALEWCITLLLALMVVLVFGNVVMRYAFNSGITVSEDGHLGTDMLTSRVPLAAKRVLAALSQALMLYATWLLFSGSLAQARINWEVEAPVTGASVAIFYASGVVFAVSSAVLLLLQLWRTVSGQATEAELTMSQESEDLAQVEALHLQDTPKLGQGPHSMTFPK